MAKGRPVEKIIEPIPLLLEEMGKALLKPKQPIDERQVLKTRLETQTRGMEELQEDIETLRKDADVIIKMLEEKTKVFEKLKKEIDAMREQLEER